MPRSDSNQIRINSNWVSVTILLFTLTIESSHSANILIMNMDIQLGDCCRPINYAGESMGIVLLWRQLTIEAYISTTRSSSLSCLLFVREATSVFWVILKETGFSQASWHHEMGEICWGKRRWINENWWWWDMGNLCCSYHVQESTTQYGS